MSVSAVSLGSLINSLPSVQNHYREFRQEFKRLGHDLQTGDLEAAQADFATLQSLRQPSPSANPPSTGKHPIKDGYNQLAQDLQTGNLAAAQQDYLNLRQAYQHLAAHRHHPQAGGGSAQLVNQIA